MYAGSIKGLLAFGMNGVQIGPNSRKNIDALKKARLAGRRRDLPGRDERVLARAGHDGRGHEGDSDHGLSAAVRGVCREGRHVRELRALAPVEERRAAAAGRRAPRSGHPRADLLERARPLSEGRRQVPRSDSQPALAVHAATEPGAAGGRSRDQRAGARRHHGCDRPGAQGRPAGAGLCLAERRRHHAVRELVVQRIVDRGGQPDGAPRHGRSVGPRHLPELGVVVAGEQARAVQPRLVRSGRQAVGSRAAADLVERGRRPLGRQRRAGLQGRFEARRTTWARSS